MQRYEPGRVILLAILGFAILVLLAWFGPAWIEASSPATSTTESKTPWAGPTLTAVSPAAAAGVRPIPTLTGKGNISQIVFLIDTSGSMSGQRLRNVKSAASKFVSRLGDQYSVSVIEFNTHVELRMPATHDPAAASQAIQSMGVAVEHDGSCVVDAFSAGIQEGAFRPTAAENEMMIILLTDIAMGDNVGWNCNLPLMDDLLTLVWNQPIPIFSIYVGEDYEPNSFLTWTAGEGAIRPAMTEKKIEETLLAISEAAGLEMSAEPATPALATDARPVSMMFVPAGEFVMGENHTVSLDAFWIDKTEVTNGMYAACVESGACNAPRSNGSNTRDAYYGNREFVDYPVVHLSWEDASAYCAWRGGRLPTEAEWEKAARGTDARPFPWGDTDPRGVPGLLNYQAQDTTAVGSYPDGASPYGALDMAGNVSEWVGDWFSPEYYNNPPASSPPGPKSGEYRVWRGGSWANTSIERLLTYSRTGNLPTDSSGGIGFRCARDVGP
jgi:formylglycine-generating enzyme required for sulfatase activity